MNRINIIAATVILLTVTSVPQAHAQRGGFGGYNSNLGMRGNRLNRFGGGFVGTSSGSTLFDLYRTDQLPLPPYFSLHPPVYYNGIDYQRYGSTPFAYPYTWWQQYGYGYNHGPPPVSAAGPTAAPSVIDNPHATSNESLRDEPKASKNTVAALITNPFVSDDPTGLNHAGPVMVANRHVATTQKLVNTENNRPR